MRNTNTSTKTNRGQAARRAAAAAAARRRRWWTFRRGPPSARALAVAQAKRQAYLAERIPADAFNKRLELQDSQAIYAMQRGMVLFKYNADGAVWQGDDGARIVPGSCRCDPPPPPPAASTTATTTTATSPTHVPRRAG